MVDSCRVKFAIAKMIGVVVAASSLASCLFVFSLPWMRSPFGEDAHLRSWQTEVIAASKAWAQGTTAIVWCSVDLDR